MAKINKPMLDHSYDDVVQVLHDKAFILLSIKTACRYKWKTHPRKRPGADAIKKFTPSLGIPYLGVRSKSWESLVTPKSGLLNF